MAFGRLPNGLGTITKLHQNLRRPYRAQKLVGEDWNEQTKKVKRVYRTVGYYKTRKEALEALMADGGVSEGGEIVTLKAIYDAWSAKKFPNLSKSSVENYGLSFRALLPIWEKRFADLRPSDYERCITKELPDTRIVPVKILIGQLYNYAIRHEIVEKDYSKSIEFEKREHTVRERSIFTPEEVQMLWEHDATVGADTIYDMILVLLYTGFRINELLTLDRTKIKDGCFVGGMKTENGRNRLVPIHPSILSIVERNARKSAFLESTRLFVTDDGSAFDEDKFRRRFKKVFPDHIVHETRHSFATYAKKSGMDLLATKRILGHSVADITEGTYTHLDVDALKAEMEKYRIE